MSGPSGLISFVPPRLEGSIFRERMEAAAASRRFSVHWSLEATPGFQGVVCEVRNREGEVAKRAGLTMLASRADNSGIAGLAERAAQWLMEGRGPGEGN